MDYRGDIGVIILNTSDEAVAFANGDRIAQAVICPVEQIRWFEVKTPEELPATDRGEGGFGSTGLNNPIVEEIKVVEDVKDPNLS